MCLKMASRHVPSLIVWCLYRGVAGMGGSYKYTEGFIKDDQSMFGAAGRNKIAAVQTCAVKRSIGEVVQSRRRPLLGPSPG